MNLTRRVTIKLMRSVAYMHSSTALPSYSFSMVDSCSFSRSDFVSFTVLESYLLIISTLNTVSLKSNPITLLKRAIVLRVLRASFVLCLFIRYFGLSGKINTEISKARQVSIKTDNS